MSKGMFLIPCALTYAVGWFGALGLDRQMDSLREKKVPLA